MAHEAIPSTSGYEQEFSKDRDAGWTLKLRSCCYILVITIVAFCGEEKTTRVFHARFAFECRGYCTFKKTFGGMEARKKRDSGFGAACTDLVLIVRGGDPPGGATMPLGPELCRSLCGLLCSLSTPSRLRRVRRRLNSYMQI
jgi:hypothetical protein